MEHNFLNMRMLSYELYDIFKLGKAYTTFIHEIYFQQRDMCHTVVTLLKAV